MLYCVGKGGKKIKNTKIKEQRNFVSDVTNVIGGCSPIRIVSGRKFPKKGMFLNEYYRRNDFKRNKSTYHP